MTQQTTTLTAPSDTDWDGFHQAHSNLVQHTTGTTTDLTYVQHTTHVETALPDTDDECLHGMTRTWCGVCKGMDNRSAYTTPATRRDTEGPSKQDLLDTMCSLLDMPRLTVGEGSSIPASIFRTAAKRADVPTGSMPQIAERITVKAGLVWASDCDSRDTSSAGGSTVTRKGLDVMILALETLAALVTCECGKTVSPDEHIDGLCFECVDALTSAAA